MSRIRTLNFLPEIFQTPTNRQFLAATLDQLVNPPVKETIQGYIGSRIGYGVNANDYYVPEPTKTRTDYQLDPGVIFTKYNESVAKDFISYPGIIDALTEQGGETSDNSRMFNSQFYSWDSFVNLDKLINYNEYYWLPEGLPAVVIGTSTTYLEEDYTVTDNANTYEIYPIDAPAVNDNPVITLLRGGTYTFAVNQSTGFWIQGEPGISGYSLTNPNQSVRNIYGVTNNGATDGTITFNVPQTDAQSLYQFPGNNTVDLVTNLTFAQIDGELLSTLGDIDGVTALENLTLMFYNGTSQANFYTITYTGSPSNPTITLVAGAGIPTNEKITVNYGNGYSGLNFYRDSFGNIAEIPYLSSMLDTLYYQDSSSPTKVGVIRIIDNNNSATIDVITDILGRPEYTSPNGVGFTNGLKVSFQGDVFPSSYLNNQYYVEGVGSSIQLIPTLDLICPEDYTTSELEPFDTFPYDINNYDASLNLPTEKDYITIARNAINKNAWSRSNRWFHSQVINATAFYNNNPNIITTYGSKNNKAIRPILEFYPNLKLFNLGTESKGFVDFLDTRTTDAFTQVMNQVCYYPDVQVYTGYNATITGVLGTSTTITVPKSSVVGTLAVNQYINDSAGLLPFDAIITGITETSVFGAPSLTLTVAWDAIRNFSTTSNLSLVANDNSNTNYQVFDGAKIIFANDNNANVKNKIYVVNFSKTSSNTPVITLTEAFDGTILTDDQMVILRGYVSTGKTYYYNGEYVLSQQKITVNQPPLFDVFDENGISFGDQTVYTSSSFAGNKLFAYGIGTGPDDPVLSFPLRYSSVNNIGDISFDVSLNKDTFDYISGSTPITQQVNTGYVYNYNTRAEYTRELGWKTAIGESVQYQIFEFDYDALLPATSYTCDVAALDSTQTPWPTTFLYVNNQIVSKDQYSVTTTSNTTTINYALISPVDTKIQIMILSDQVSKTAYYGIPINLNNNPFNANLAEVNTGEIRGQYQSIFYNNPNSQGSVFGSNNYRDLGTTVPYGTSIIQNSASLVLPGTFLRKKNNYLFDALLFNSREYIKYKSLLVSTVNNIAFDQSFNGSNVLDAAIEQITSTKSQEQPFFWSDMLPAKAPIIINSYVFNNYLDQSIFPLTKTYDFSTANYYGLLIYVTRTYPETNITTTKQLVKGVDYTVNPDAPYVTVTYDLLLNDIVTVKEYTQSYGSYVPNTPTKLGLYPSFVPEIITDYSFVTPTTFIRGHDGSYNKLYGDYDPVTGVLFDFRDQALFEFECRIYNNLKLSSTVPIQEYEVLPGFFRDTDYTYEEFLKMYSVTFLNWVGENRINYQRQYYNVNNQFTYNYSNTRTKIDSEILTIGSWRGIYQYFYDTATPDTAPWQMLGYTDKPTWWDSRYGAAPYTSDNLVLWGDLEQGLDWNDGNPVIIPSAIRPGLTSVIPVDQNGDLLPPIKTVVGNYNPDTMQKDWKVGDVGAAEYSYRRSSSYPFDLMRIFALTKPAKFFNLGVDLDNYKYNVEFDQYLVNNRNHLIISDIEIYGSGTPKTSYVNWIVDYEKQAGIDATKNITDTLDSLDVRLVYRMAGFSDKNMLQFFVEKSSANDANSSLLIPDESYSVLLYDNQPYDRIVYSPVIVQLTSEGFAVFGNSQVTAYFKTLTPVINGSWTNITVEKSSVKIANDYEAEEIIVPYGTVFYSLQSLSQFLMSYGKYLQSKGMLFTEIDPISGVEINWDLMIQEFLYWSQFGWETGNVITLNPAALSLVIDKENQIVQPLTIQDSNFVLNQNLYPIKSSDISVIRDETYFNVKPLNKGDAISYGQFNLSNFEHGVVFDNVTVFDDVIYNLTTGLRQNRIFVRGTKTADWNGTVTASGFIYNQDNITEWNQQVKYTKGSIVKYKNKYWTALTIVQPGHLFSENEWKVTDYNEVQKGLLPNSSTRSYETALYYNVNKANLENDADLLSFSLVGYRPRDYLALADLTDITQINVYKNMIKSKGTRAALDSFKGAQLPQGGIDYDVYENWAIKSGEFGGILNDNFIEFRVNQSLLTGNPSIVSLVSNYPVDGAQQQIPLSALFNYGRPISSPNALPVLTETPPSTLYPTAGYVNFNDVKMSSFFYSQAETAVDINGVIVPINEFYVRDYYWVANYRNQWEVFSPESIGQVLSVTSNLNGTATVTFAQDHGLERYEPFAIVNFNSAVNGYYLVNTVLNTRQVLIGLQINSNNKSVTGIGVGYKFNSQRVVSPADIITLPLLNAEFVKNTVWVDENVDGNWAVYRKSLNYKYATQLSKTGSSSYGSAVAYTNDAGYLVSDPNLGELYRYEYNSLLNSYILDQTISSGVSYGTCIAHEQNIYIVSEPTSAAPKVHIYIQNPTELTQSLVPYQAPIPPSGYATEWGSKVALSGDTRWLYISDAVGQKIYVYRKQDFSVSSGYFVVGETYTITNVGNTDFTLLGAIQNKVGITFIATGSGALNQTGVAQQVTYKYSTMIDGSLLGEEFGNSLATDYYGDTLVVGAPGYDYSSTASNSGTGYVFARATQNFEAQTNGSGQIFTLAWTPTAPPAITTLGTSSVTGVSCSASMTGFSVNDTVIFTPTTSPTDFSGTNITPNTTYYVQSISGSFIKLKQSRSTSTVYTVSNSSKNLNVCMQIDPLYVTVNGTIVDPINYAYVGNTFYYTGTLNAGDIINVSDNKFTLVQTLESPETARTGVQFSRGLDVTQQASEILVGAPFTVNSNNQEGAVYRYTNAGGKFGVVTGTREVAITTPKNLLINGYLVELTGNLDANGVATAINNATITNIAASSSNNILTIQVINSDLAQINEKLLLSVVDTATFDELGIDLYTQTQTILCPHEVGPTQFGRTVKFNEYDSVVISAPVGTRYAATTFDFTDDENLTNDTLFDSNSTQFIDSYPNAGAVYMFDYLGTYDESLSNLGQFVYAQCINSIDQEYGNKPMYGYALDFHEWNVVAGAPEYRIDSVTGCETTLGNAGLVTVYTNSIGIKDWSVYREPSATVDISGIENAQIFSAETNNTLINLDYIDPLQGKILGAVRQNIDVVSNTDPAGYNAGTNTNGKLVWGAEQVGSLWFNTTNVRFVNYHQNDVTYNSKYWGTLFPGSDVAIYSWIASTVPPASYQGPGTPFNTTTYTVQANINASNAVVPTYYFWVRNTDIVFTKRGKTLADTILEAYIRNPKNSGISYMAPLLPNTFALYNTQEYINANDSVLHVGFKSSNNIDVGHSEYTLIRANYAEDFLPGVPNLVSTDHIRAIHGTATYASAPPESLYDKLLDSMAGVDETGAVVPNPLLPKAVQSGVLVRPRQSFFYNRLGALKNYLQYANEILSQYPITELRPGATYLFAQNPITYNKTINATNMVAGEQYVIVSTGSTNYTQYGSGSNIIGTVFTATGPGTGSGTVDVLVGEAVYSATEIVEGSRYVIETIGDTDFVALGASSNVVGVEFTAIAAGSNTDPVPGTVKQVLFDVGEEYDTSNYWDYVNWWATGYDDATKAAIQVPVYASLATLSVSNGTIASVATNGSGKTEFYRYDSELNDWTRIGLQAGTIQFKSILWDYAEGRFGWGSNFYDTTVYDLFPSEETRYIMRALNEQIYTDELVIHRNKSLILLFEYIQSETVESQNMLPWLNKTSLVDVTHTIRDLRPIEVFRSDNQAFLSGYLNEVKPYHVLIKEFLFKYTGSELYRGNITDFDLPSQYNAAVNQFITPQLVYSSPKGNNQFLPDDAIWQERIYTPWRANYGLNLVGVNDYNISTLVSYVSLASDSIIVTNVWGFPINGYITIGTEQIFYNNVDRDLGILYNLQRGANFTTVTEHLPGEEIYMNLPPVIVLDGGRGYVNPPRVTAYIDTTIYPAPTVEAVLEPVMYLDSVLSVNVIDPGLGYAVQPDIIIDAAQTVVFTSADVDVRSNTMRLFAPTLQTGDMVRYEVGTGTPIAGLVDHQWYYVAVLETIPVYVVGFYNNYSNAINDHDRVEIYSQGTGSHTINMGARAVAVTQSSPVRENITTLRFDRTTYTSQVTDWTANSLYAAPFIGDYYTSEALSASAIKLYSTLPEINSIPASAHGFVLQISDVSNDQQVYWSSFVRRLDKVWNTTGSGDTNVITLVTTGGSLPNSSGSTIGFEIGMPIKFVPNTSNANIALSTANISANTTYYVAEIIDKTNFKIKNVDDEIIQIPQSIDVVNTSVNIYTAQTVDTAILTVNYPGIRTATSTTNFESSQPGIYIPMSDIGTGGTLGMYTNLPVYFVGNVFGGLIENQIYYVNSVIDREYFTVSETQNPLSVTVTDTNAIDNIITVVDTEGLAPEIPVLFTGNAAFGNIEFNKIYYVKQVFNDTEITISETLNGASVTLTTASGSMSLVSQANAVALTNATGSMTVNIALPISPGQVNGQEFTLYSTSNNYPNITSYTIDNLVEFNATATLSTVNRIIVDGIVNMYINMPFQVNVYTGSGLTVGTTYYVYDFGQVTANVTGTSAVGNLVICDSTASLYNYMPVTFSGTGISNIVIGKQYYINNISSSTEFTISATIGGPEIPLTNALPYNTITLESLYYVEASSTVSGSQIPLLTVIDDFTVTQTPTVSSVVANATATIATVDRVIVDSIANVYANMTIETSASVGGLTTSTIYYVADLGQVTANVTGTNAAGNLIICDSTASFYTDMPVVFSGDAISNVTLGQQYYVESISSSTEFAISATVGGSQIELPTQTVTNSIVEGLYYLQLENIYGNPVTLSSSVTNFTIISSTPKFNVSWILGGYRVLVTYSGSGFAVDNLITIPGNYVGGTTPANDVKMYVNTVGTLGEIIDVNPSGVVPSSSNSYYLKALTPNTMAVYSDPRMTTPVSGIDFSYTGFTSANVKSIGATSIVIFDPEQFAVNDSIVFTNINVTCDIVEGNTYFITSLDNVILDISSGRMIGTIQISQLPGGPLFYPNGPGIISTNYPIIAKAGSYAFLPEPFYFDQSIVKYNNSLYACVVSNGDPDFVYGKWELVRSGDRRLNALDRIVGYYQPTDNMPGNDLSQLVANIVYPNSTYLGNAFEPSLQWPVDTQLIDEPFYPTNVDLVSVTNNGNIFLAPANLPEYSGIAKDDVGEQWDLYKLSEQPLNITDISYSANTYIMTSTNTPTPIFTSTDGVSWTTSGYYTSNAALPWSNSTTGLTMLNSANLSLRSAASSNDLWVAVGDGVILTSDDNYIWRETYTGNATLDYKFFGVTNAYSSTGFVAVGSGLVEDSGNLVDTGIVAYSANGIVWSNSSLVTDKKLYGVTTNSSTIVAVGEDGAIFTSTNGGIAWTGVRETQLIGINSGNERVSVVTTTNFEVDNAVRTNNSFNGLLAGTTYYIANVVSTSQLILSPDAADTVATSILASTRYQITDLGTTDFTLIGASSNTVGVIFTASGPGTGTGTARRLVNLTGTSGAPPRTFLYKMPVTDTLRDVCWNGSRFMAVGDNGEIRTSTTGSSWVNRISGTTQDLTGITYKAPYWIAVGENNTVLRSTGTGVTWEAISSFVEAAPAYDVQGDPFLSGYGPEELVPGIINDGLAMTVTTRPGTTWEATEYAHVGYKVVSIELQATSATQNKFSFFDVVSVPAQVSCFIIDSTTELSTTIYQGVNGFTVDWINQQVVFSADNPLNYVGPSSPGNKLRIDVYEVGNGNQLEKSCTNNDPIRVNPTTGFNEIYLNCNYNAAVWQGSGVVQTGSYPIEVNAYATDAVTNQIFLDSVEAITENTPITFTGGVFGNIQEDVVYYVKSVAHATNSITVSTSYNITTGLAGATQILSTATGSMICVIAYGNGTVYTDPIVYHGTTTTNNKLVLGKTNSVSRTKAYNNAITCNSTGGLIVNTPIVFSDTMFGGVSPQTTYYIKSIVDANEFTISTTVGGPAVSLTNAVGSAVFVTNDYAFGLNDNGITAKMIFAAQYDADADYICYSILGQTIPTQYGYTIPQTQVFTYSGSTTFNLSNYVASDWLDSSVVEVNGVRLSGSSYYIDTIGNNITISYPLTLGDTVAVTLFNDTQRQYFNTIFGLTGSVGSVGGLVVGSTSHISIRYDELTTAGSFIIGQEYIIQSIGTTNFTLIGAASNTVGLSFVATGVGSGTGTAAVGYDDSAYDESYDWLTLSTGTTASLVINDAIVFLAPTIGGIVAGQTYYVIEILNSTDFVISETLGGTPFEVYSQSGSMSFDTVPIRVSNIATISNTLSAPATSVYVTGTTTGTNLITCSSTGGMTVGDTAIFKGTSFGGLATDGTVYFINSVVSGTQFTIKDESGSIIPLSTASGYVLVDVGGQPAVRVQTAITHNFTENDLINIDGTSGSIQLNGNVYYAKIIDSYTFDLYEQPYNPALFAINYPVLYCSTYTGGGYTWLSGLFRLRTTTATLTNSVSNYITVVDTSKLIEDTPVYFTQPGVPLGTAILGGLIAGQKYYISQVVTSTQITVSETWGGPVVALTTDSGSTYVTQWEQDNVDRLWVTVNGYRVPSSSLRLFPANEIAILTTISTGAVVAVTSMMPSETPDEQVYVNLVNQFNEAAVYRANSKTKTWLTQNLDVLDTVIYVNDVTRLTNFVTQHSITPAAVNNVYTVGINANRREIQSISILNISQSIAADAIVIGQNYKITTVGDTNWMAVGASDNEVGVVFTATGVATGTGFCNGYIDPANFTQGIVNVAPVVFIDEGSWISPDDELEITTTVGRDIMINGELIRIYAVDTINNTITNFTRGVDNTAIRFIQPKYSEVFSLLNENRMSDTLYAQTWNSDIYNPVLGDPLQISETDGAVFLNVDIT